MSIDVEARTAPGQALAMFVMGKDVSHHVRRVVLDFIPRIEREAARLVPAEDEGRLREALARMERLPYIDRARRRYVERVAAERILRDALAATPEPRP